MLRIETSDFDTDESIGNHLSGYIVDIMRDGVSVIEGRLEGIEWNEDELALCYVVSRVIDTDTWEEFEDESEYFDTDECVLSIA